MSLTKLVNGERVTISPEKEQNIRDEWEANIIETNQLNDQKEQQELERQAVIQKLAQSADVSTEDIEKVLK